MPHSNSCNIRASGLFDVEAWIDRLSTVLPKLRQAQAPYLEEYWCHRPRTRRIVNDKDVTPYPLDDVRTVYANASHSRRAGMEAHYRPLLELLDSTRHILLSHPELDRVAVAGRTIGENDFYMEILNSGMITYARDLIAGLMARAAEVSEDGFRVAAKELNALLVPAINVDTASVLGDLEMGYHALLFHGLTLTKRIDFQEGISMLPIADLQGYIDRELVEELAPTGAGFHKFRSVGTFVLPFRWRPNLKRRGSFNDPAIPSPDNFIRDAQIFLNLVTVSHQAPVTPLAVVRNCIHGSAARLLGRENHGTEVSERWPVGGFDGFTDCPKLKVEALKEALEGFRNRRSKNYRKMDPFVFRLTNALRRDGWYEISDKVLDLAIALEGMYELPRNRKSKKLGDRVSRFIGENAEERSRIKETIQSFYDARSDVVHSGSGKDWPLGKEAVFNRCFSLARRSLYKFLREGGPDNWDD